MGYFISKLNDTKLNEYIGSQTIYSCADKSAFDGDVSEELEEYADDDESIHAIVDEDGVENFLNILKSGVCSGRDVTKFIEAVEENYMDGFIMRT